MQFHATVCVECMYVHGSPQRTYGISNMFCGREGLSLDNRADNKQLRVNQAIVKEEAKLHKILLTMVTQKKESAGAEVAVELEQDVIGRAGNGLLRQAAAELTDLWGCLVRAVPKGDNRSVQTQI